MGRFAACTTIGLPASSSRSVLNCILSLGDEMDSAKTRGAKPASFNQPQGKDPRPSPVLLLLILGLTGSVGLVGCSGVASSTTQTSQTGAAISVVPSSIPFGNVAVGATNTQMVRVSNTGSLDLTISQGSVTGTGFSLSGLSVPLRIAAGQSSTFTVAFA